MGALAILVDRAVCRRGPVRGIRHPFADRTYREDGAAPGAGDLTARVAPPYPGGELGSLMTVLNHTASSLELQRHDIEELNQKLRRARELEALEKQRLDVAVNNMAQGLILYDASERVVICNQQFTKMMGIIGPCSPKPGCSFREVIAHRSETGSLAIGVEEYRENLPLQYRCRERMRRPYRPCRMDVRSTWSTSRSRAAAGSRRYEDITERKRAEARIAHMAHYDALTDLPNRMLFRERLDQALSTRAADEQLAVLCPRHRPLQGRQRLRSAIRSATRC